MDIVTVQSDQFFETEKNVSNPSVTHASPDAGVPVGGVAICFKVTITRNVTGTLQKRGRNRAKTRHRNKECGENRVKTHREHCGNWLGMWQEWVRKTAGMW